MIDNITNIADRASAQSDRWLMIVLGLLLLLGGAFLWRWVSGQYQRMLDANLVAHERAMADQRELHRERVAATETYATKLAEIAAQQAKDHRELWANISSTLLKQSEEMGKLAQAIASLQTACTLSRQLTEGKR